ncbi:MAG TPA: vanadium-dependent haloperoxidase [Actinomycetes bacterium]|nr:vanadium-dependent haloperoxidase [Actinomycetes bacterium]
MARRLPAMLGLVVAALALGSLATAVPEPARAATGDNLVLVWNDQTLQSIRKLPPAPTVAARALAVVHTAIYDAWAAYDPLAVGTQLGAGLRQPEAERTQANKDKAVSYAAYTALMDLFPALQADFTTRMASLYGDEFAADTTAPATVGFTAAQAVLNLRHDDGSNQLGGYADTSGYVPVNSWDQVNDPDQWQPLCVPLPPPGASSCTPVQKFATPHWRGVTPFALTTASQFRPDHGPAVTVVKGKPSDAFVKEVDQLLKFSAGLTDTQKAVAQYWEDPPGSETPPGHWNLIAQWVSRRDHHTLDVDAKLFMALNNALLDASITAWDAKRQWNSVRPITAVRWLKQGQLIQAWGGPYQGTRTIRGEDWLPYQRSNFVTPPFPEYISGHSTFSAAAAAVLKAATGSDTLGMSVTIPAGSSTVEPATVPAAPVTLSWKSFSAAADQAGISREYGGIHFNDGDYEARQAGEDVGLQAWSKAKTYFSGKAIPKA